MYYLCTRNQDDGGIAQLVRAHDSYHEVPSSILGPATLPRLITQCVVSFFYVIIIYRMLLGLISCNQIAHQYFFNIACAEHYLCTCYTLLYSSVLWLVYIPF